jgi:hypothetical protein
MARNAKISPKRGLFWGLLQIPRVRQQALGQILYSLALAEFAGDVVQSSLIGWARENGVSDIVLNKGSDPGSLTP